MTVNYLKNMRMMNEINIYKFMLVHMIVLLHLKKNQLDQMRRLLTILTSDQRKLLTEVPPPKENLTIDKESSDDSQTTNKDDDTKLHVARYHKTETDWDELLTQITQIMDLSQKFCDKCSQQREENNKLRLLNSQKQDENVKLLFDLSLAKAEYEKEQQIRIQIEKQLSDTNTILDQLTNLTKKNRKNRYRFS